MNANWGSLAAAELETLRAKGLFKPERVIGRRQDAVTIRG